MSIWLPFTEIMHNIVTEMLYTIAIKVSHLEVTVSQIITPLC